MPPGVEGYATRTVDRLVAQAACYGESAGIYARRLLDGDAPWMMMRSACRLIGLAKRYGAGAAEAACARALDVDVINVSRSIDAQERHRERPASSRPHQRHRRWPRPVRPDAAEYATATGIRLRVVAGGNDTARPAATQAAVRGGAPSPAGDRS